MCFEVCFALDQKKPKSLNQSTYKALLDDLSSNQDSAIRLAAAKKLGEIRDVLAVEPLIAALNDKSISVRIVVAEALGKFTDKRAVSALLLALKDKDFLFAEDRWDYKQAVGKSLKKLTGKDYIKELYDISSPYKLPVIDVWIDNVIYASGDCSIKLTLSYSNVAGGVREAILMHDFDLLIGPSDFSDRFPMPEAFDHGAVSFINDSKDIEQDFSNFDKDASYGQYKVCLKLPLEGLQGSGQRKTARFTFKVIDFLGRRSNIVNINGDARVN